MATATATPATWLTAPEAARLVGEGVRASHIRLWAQCGIVGVRALPGVAAMYNRGDVERIARESIRLARRDSIGKALAWIDQQPETPQLSAASRQSR